MYKLNAIDVIDVIKQINNLFPIGKPSRDQDKRNDVINSWDDGEYDELIEQIDSKFRTLTENLESKIDPVIERIILKNKSGE